MARNRMIKPEAFSDAKLSSVSRDARYTFIGMWVFSDDFGVVKGNVRWLISQVYEEDETVTQELMQAWLSELVDKQFLIPFESDGKKYYHIRNWHKHQKVDHPSEKHRNPKPPKSDASCSRESRDGLDTDSKQTHSRESRETFTRVSEGSTERLAHQLERERELETELEKSHVETPGGVSGPPSEDVSKIQLLWNQFAEETGLPAVIKLNQTRISSIRQRAREKEFDLDRILKKIRGSPFLLGKKGNWRADFDFVFCSKSNYLKILEGSYDGQSESKKVSEQMKNFLERHREEA